MKFLTLNADSEQIKEKSLLSSVLVKNQEIESVLEQVKEENKNLRSMLKLHQDNNSFKSFAKELKEMEEKDRAAAENPKNTEDPETATVEVSLSPTQDKTKKHNAEDIVKSTIRARNKRLGRKRTESFHFSSMGESSSDEEPKKSMFKMKRKSTATHNDFAGYKMQVKEDSPTEEDSKSVDSDSKDLNKPKETPKKVGRAKRSRINSNTDESNMLSFSPPNKKDQKDSTKITPPSDFSFDSLMKGGGYKMAVQNSDNEESKTESNDDDYFGCFNKKNKRANRIKRIKSVLADEDYTKNELYEATHSFMPKIKYSISIIEEEKSKSSSSNSSIKSSDDLTFLFASRDQKRKKSSF